MVSAGSAAFALCTDYALIAPSCVPSVASEQSSSAGRYRVHADNHLNLHQKWVVFDNSLFIGVVLQHSLTIQMADFAQIH